MEDQGLIFYSIAAALVCGSLLYAYHFHLDPYKNIERFYFKRSKTQYAIFKLAYTTILLSTILSVRFLFVKLLLSSKTGTPS